MSTGVRNLASKARSVRIDVDTPPGQNQVVDLLDQGRAVTAMDEGCLELKLEGYGFRWFASKRVADGPHSEPPASNDPPFVGVDRSTVIFGFNFTPLYRRVAMAWGITPGRARVEVSHDELLVRFGPWSLRTAISNVSATEITGPYSVPKTIGPAHLSLVDRGVTFATNPRLGLCVRLRHAVPAIEPFGLIRHPALTVTVGDVEGLRAAVQAGL